MRKSTKGQNSNSRGGRPRDKKLERAVALVDVASVTVELKRDDMPKKVSPHLRPLVESFSESARTTGILTLEDALLLLSWQFKGDVEKVESFKKAEKRYRKRWAAEGGAPLLTQPEPRKICMCPHRHCGAWCRTWSKAPASCGRLIAEGVDWTLPSPCRAGATVCHCRHVHCEGCGVGASEPDPIIQPAYTCRIVLDQLDLQRLWIGWLCPDCMPEEFQSVPEPPEAPRGARTAPPACPAAGCGGDVEIDGDTFRCVGLDGASNRLRTEVRLRQSLKVRLLSPTGFAGPEEVQAFHERQHESLRTLPKTLPALPACGRMGNVSELAQQEWRVSAARAASAPRKSARHSESATARPRRPRKGLVRPARRSSTED